MTGPLPEAAVEHLGTTHLEIAVVLVDATHVLLYLLPDRPAVRVPEHHPGGFLLQVKKIELGAELPVVAFFRLLEHAQIGVLLFLLRPGRAVDPLQHRVVRVAAPIGTGNLHEFENFQLAGRGHVRAAAQVDEVSFSVQRHFFARGNCGDDLGFVVLADRFEEFDRFVARPHLADDRQVLCGQFGHALLDRGEILERKGTLIREVVIEAVLDHRTDGDLRFREEILHGVSEQMRGGVANELDAFLVAVRDDRHFRIALDTIGRVHQPAVHPAGERGARQARADRFRNIRDRNRSGKTPHGTVWKANVRHA